MKQIVPFRSVFQYACLGKIGLKTKLKGVKHPAGIMSKK